jgi:hypothetical protein
MWRKTSLGLPLGDPHQSRPRVLFQMLFEIGESDHGVAKTLSERRMNRLSPRAPSMYSIKSCPRVGRFNTSCLLHRWSVAPDCRSWPLGRLIPSFMISSSSNSSSYEPVKPAYSVLLVVSHHQVVQFGPDIRFGQELEKLAAGPVKPVV